MNQLQKNNNVTYLKCSNRTGEQNIRRLKIDLASEVMMISKGKGRGRGSAIIEVVFYVVKMNKIICVSQFIIIIINVYFLLNEKIWIS